MTAPAGVKKHSLVIAGHRTSVSLEAAFWDALKRIAATDGCSLGGARRKSGRGARRGESFLGAASICVGAVSGRRGAPSSKM